MTGITPGQASASKHRERRGGRARSSAPRPARRSAPRRAAPRPGRPWAPASGLLGGTTAGASRAEGSSASVQRRYDMTYVQCMYAKGNQVPIPVR